MGRQLLLRDVGGNLQQKCREKALAGVSLVLSPVAQTTRGVLGPLMLMLANMFCGRGRADL